MAKLNYQRAAWLDKHRKNIKGESSKILKKYLDVKEDCQTEYLRLRDWTRKGNSKESYPRLERLRQLEERKNSLYESYQNSKPTF